MHQSVLEERCGAYKRWRGRGKWLWYKFKMAPKQWWWIRVESLWGLDSLANQSCWFLALCLSLLTKRKHISVPWICSVCHDESIQRVQTTCWDVKKRTIKEMKTWKQSLVTDNCHMLKDAEFQAVSLKTAICLSDEYYTIWNARLLVCYFLWWINEERNYFSV